MQGVLGGGVVYIQPLGYHEDNRTKPGKWKRRLCIGGTVGKGAEDFSLVQQAEKVMKAQSCHNKVGHGLLPWFCPINLFKRGESAKDKESGTQPTQGRAEEELAECLM